MATTMPPTMTPRTTIITGSMRREQRAHRDVHFLVVEVGDLGEHLVQAAGLLADGDHRDHHRREDLGLLQRAGDGLTAGDRVAGLHHRVVDDPVAGGLGGDLEAVEDRHAGADQGAERPGEAGDGRLPEQVAQHRGVEQHLVDLLPPVGGGVVPPDGEDDADDDQRSGPTSS